MLLCVLALGIGLRVYRFGAPGLWTDEFISYWVIEDGNITQIVSRCFDYTPCPPLYFLVLKGSVTLLGKSEWAMRLPSVILGSALLVLAFFFAKTLFNWEAGIISTTVLSLNPPMIFQSQNARMYSLALVIALVCVWSFLRILRREGGWWSCLVYFASAVALFYTHYVYASVIAFTNVYYVVRWLRDPRRRWQRLVGWVMLHVVLAATLLPGLRALLARRAGVVTQEAVAFGSALPIMVKLVKLEYVVAALLAALGIEYLMGGLAGLGWRPGEKDREGIAFTVYWFGVTALVVVAAGLLIDPILLWERYALASELAGAVLIGVLITFLRPARLRLILVIVLVGLLLLPRALEVRRTGNFVLSHHKDHERGWRDVLTEADRAIEGDDIVYVQSTILETMERKGLIYSDDATLQRYLGTFASGFYLTRRPEMKSLPVKWDREVFEDYYVQRFREVLDERGRIWVACAKKPFYQVLHQWLAEKEDLGVRRALLIANPECHIALYERACEVKTSPPTRFDRTGQEPGSDYTESSTRIAAPYGK